MYRNPISPSPTIWKYVFFFSHSYDAFKIQPLFINLLIISLGSMIQDRLSTQIITEMYTSIYMYITYTYKYITIHNNFICFCRTRFI